MASSISSIWRRRSSRDGVLSDIGPRYLHGKAELLIVGGPGKIKDKLAFQPLRTGYARPAQGAAAGGASPEESPEETIYRLARGSLAKEPPPPSLGGAPDLRRSACRSRILPLSMARPATGALRAAAAAAPAKRGLTVEVGRSVPQPS